MAGRKNVLLILVLVAITGTAWAQTSNPQQYKYVFTVAKDGTGDYKYIQDAIDAMRVYPLAAITLFIKNGVYNEKIELPATNTDVSFVGESVDKTIITFNDYAGRGKLITFTSYTAKISGNRFRASNITFVNAAGPVGQALALYVDADQAVFTNCRFIGNQDTIFASGESSRQFFYDCYIEGTTDFIFGASTAVFARCSIKCKSNSFITAANTPAGKKFGFVFIDCHVSADTGVTKLWLGRPWRAFAKTVFLRCVLPGQVAPEGWNNWNNPENENTTWYAEYKNTGDGSNTTGRVRWSHQLTDKEAKDYTVENIFGSGNTTLPTQYWYLDTSRRSFEWPARK